jgi:hypothetical protein
MHSHICIVAPYIGTLAETLKEVVLEPKLEDGVWRIHPEDGRIGRVPDWEMLAKWVLSDKL